MARVLVVEDEPDIALGLQEDLVRHGYEVEVARDGDVAVRRATADQWDVIILDVMLPYRDGFEVCRELRKTGSRTPIIMLTARAQEAEKILGFEFGADDYVTKPFSPGELRARMKAVMRRTEPPPEPVNQYAFGDCEIDFDRAEVRRAGGVVELTALEFRILSAFVRSRGRLLTRDELIRRAWGDNTFIGDRVVDTHILNLRRKIEPTPAEPQFIRSIRGMGYRFDG
jgi:two-component system alkaline phosphatase synthesis response regulator PhoP